MKEHNKNIILFTGYNQRACISFLRTLSDIDVTVAIVAAGENDPILRTKYSKHVTVIRKTKSLEIEDILTIIKTIYKQRNVCRSLLAPSTEALNRFMLDNVDKLKEVDCTVPLVSIELYKRISDKYSFSTLCKSYNIVVPEEYGELSELRIPLVAKPRSYIGSQGKALTPVLLLREKDIHSYKNNYSDEDFYFQEYVNGESIYLLYYFSKDQKVLKYSQTNVAQQPGGKSIVAATSADIHHESISHKFEKMFLDIGYRGLVMVEVIKSNDKYYMIEANPRFWGPSQLFVDANVNFFKALLVDYQYLDESCGKKEQIRDVRYCWYGGMHKYLGKDLIYHKGDEKKMVLGLHDWLEWDVYRRNDTTEIFVNELK